VARALRVGFENERAGAPVALSEAEARAARERAEEANRAKSRFLAAASHDLRQPLHSLTLLLDHAVRTTEEPKIEQTCARRRARPSRCTSCSPACSTCRASMPAASRPRSSRCAGQVLERIDNDYRPLALGKGLAFEC
jgi:signal transduction histidine kinase